MKKYSVIIAKQHATSFSLEEEFYAVLQQIAKKQNIPLNSLITKIDNSRTTTNLSSALRLYILDYLLQKLKQI